MGGGRPDRRPRTRPDRHGLRRPATPTADTAAACAFYDGDALTMYGQRGDRVSQIQCMLANRHYLPWKAVDGVFGDRTLAAVERFQRDHPPLAVDGMVGTLTWNALWYA